MKCRFCDSTVKTTFVDLINSPPSNAYLSEAQLNEAETYYPLKVMVCESCFLVQVDEYKKHSEIFNSEYAYFSSYSKSWLAHSKAYVEKMIKRLKLDENSFVAEIASNDGYLLQYFQEQGIPVLGIEPTANTAEVAIQKGIPTEIEFFGKTYASTFSQRHKQVDLLLGNNVLAHVPDLIDFVGGMPTVLAPQGVLTMEFPHLLELVLNNQFDTIYHEHFSYLSLFTVKQIFESQGLELFDVERISTHGGSLRIFAKHKSDDSKSIQDSVNHILEKEKGAGVNTLTFYEGFQFKVNQIKVELINFLVTQKMNGKCIAAYGAAAKGNTLLNYCGIKNDQIDFVVDANPHKQNKFMPGSHIPIVDASAIRTKKPDFIIILPWNIKEEIMDQLKYVEEWGAKFVIAIPNLKIV